MKKELFQNILLLFFSIFILMVLGELAVRGLGKYDADGNFQIGGKTLRPYVLPVTTSQQKIEQYLKDYWKARVQYDPELGWTNAASVVSEDSLYCYNKMAIRVPALDKEYPFSISTDTFRIVLIGDSFTQCDEVPYEQSWPFFLEEKLNRENFKAQVINLGVSGYGMDQAYLRWKTFGKKLHPDLVIFGLQMENVRRNVNLLRPVYHPSTNLIFSKPRFILENDSLHLINTPPVKPENVPSILADIEQWPLSKYEYFYKPDDYKQHWYLKIKFVAFLRELMFPDKSLNVRPPIGIHTGVYPLNEEPAQVTLKILETFKQDVEANKAEYALLHMPHIWGLGYYRKYGSIPYSDLLEKIREDFILIDTKEAFMEQAGQHKNDDFYLSFHYSELGNKIVADVMAKYILEKYGEQ